MSNDPDFIERRANAKTVWLTEEQIELIAERAAEKATKRITDNFYREVGRQVVQRIIISVVGAGVIGWALLKGWVSFNVGAGK